MRTHKRKVGFGLVVGFCGIVAAADKAPATAPGGGAALDAVEFPKDLTVWPNHRSKRNSDAWLVKNHDTIRKMRPRVLVLNFCNGFAPDKAEGMAQQLAAAVTEGTRYHGRSLWISFINAERGIGCNVESLSHAMEGTANSGVIPYYRKYFCEFAGHDFDTRWKLPWISFYPLWGEGKGISYPDDHTAVIKGDDGKPMKNWWPFLFY